MKFERLKFERISQYVLLPDKPIQEITEIAPGAEFINVHKGYTITFLDGFYYVVHNSIVYRRDNYDDIVKVIDNLLQSVAAEIYEGVALYINLDNTVSFYYGGQMYSVEDAEAAKRVINALIDEHTEKILTISSQEGGTTDPAPGAIPYISGQAFLVKAIPNEGYVFTGWICSWTNEIKTENPLSVVL